MHNLSINIQGDIEISIEGEWRRGFAISRVNNTRRNMEKVLTDVRRKINSFKVIKRFSVPIEMPVTKVTTHPGIFERDTYVIL